MDTYRIFNDVSRVEPLYKVAGANVSKPVAWLFAGYVLAVFVGAIVFSQTGTWIPMALIGVVGGVLIAALLVLDMRLRGHGLKNVMVQIRLLHSAARSPMSRNY